MPITITLDGEQESVDRIATILRGAGLMPAAPVDPPPPVQAAVCVCPLCRAVYTPAEARRYKAISGEICSLCYEAACRLDERFRMAALNHYRDFVGQLRQMIRDVRSGADEPTFYRGLSG